MNKTTKLALQSFLAWVEIRALFANPLLYLASKATMSIIRKLK